MSDVNERSGALTWLHFGDLHIQAEQGETYQDFLCLIEEANENLGSGVDFAFLPGDNADDGTEDEYRLVRRALDGLRLPVHAITGDHDRKAGTLDCFEQYLEPELFRSRTMGRFGLLFLNAMDGPDKKTFDFGEEQWSWLVGQLQQFEIAGLRPLIFTHLYPSELHTRGNAFSALIRPHRVELVEMGHTHYNELANDGRTIYAATRSTGQIEEGPPGFSLTVIDNDVVSWRFKPRGAWPLTMITSPSDYRLITDSRSPRHVLRDDLLIRAKAWHRRGIAGVNCSIDGARPQPMHQMDANRWQIAWNPREAGEGLHKLRVEATAEGGESGSDEIRALVNERGDYTAPHRSAVDFENALGAWPEKGILGTQLGPNENGTKGPWPCWRSR